MFLLEVSSALEKAKIDYAIVGGYAVALHGVLRATFDLDIVLNIREADFKAAEKSFKGLGLLCRLPVSGSDVFHFRKEYIEKRNLVAWSFYDPKNPTRVLDVVITEDLKNLKVAKINVKGIPIRVASKEALIQMKKKSGRPQDLEDVRALESL